MNPLSSGVHPQPEQGPLVFDRLVEAAGEYAGVARHEMAPGDRLQVFTRNSVYTLTRLDDGRFLVGGGWFDRMSGGPAVVSVIGCTWGGSAIHRDLVAGCGMRIEFSNRVLTSTVLRVVHFPVRFLN